MGSNSLIQTGNQVFAFLPPSMGDKLQDALIGGTYQRADIAYAVKHVARWEESVYIFLQARAPDHTALFTTADAIPDRPTELRAYMEKRLAELKDIHAQL